MLIVSIFINILDPLRSVALDQLIHMRPLFQVFIKLLTRKEKHNQTRERKGETELRAGGSEKEWTYIPEDRA